MNNNIEVINLTKKDLSEAIDLNTYWKGSFDPPFSKEKAKWMLKNDRANDNDIFAILAYENHNLVSFISLIPDWIEIGEGNRKKIFWSQRWWVSDKYKNTILAAYTKNNSLIETNNQVIVRFLGDKTQAYYKKQAFTKFSKRTRYIIVFNLDYKLLIYKKNVLKKVRPILKFLDKISGKTISSINRRKSNRLTKDLTCHYVSFVDDSTWAFIEKHCINDIVPKTKEYISWQISNDQYHVVTNDTIKPNYKCLLESISKKINNLNFIVKSKNQSIGFISGLIKGNRFVLRYFLTNDENFDKCLDALMKNFIMSKCKLLQTENNMLGCKIKSKYLNVYTDSKNLFSLAHEDINDDLTNVIINDRDGNFI